ncbi:MAG: phosphoribosylformylglycinamidine cyclo-ligase [Candidatus Omnitrophica bacterium]|nr:phosphoribosylformylglycinamidine cyclo-ligase [Candidatus Omnitrophota bacterium]
MMTKRLTYKSSGVDIAKANKFKKEIKSLVARTFTKEVMGGIGGFGSLYDFSLAKYKHPILVSSSDGVGTKLIIAKLVNKHDTVGIDLVAMNTNDILCLGAKPIFFLDYIASGKLDPQVLRDVIKGIAEGCKQSACSLIGGETAELPGMYAEGDYDLGGFVVGVVEKGKIIDGSKIKVGDKLIGLASSGIHSNGYSLVRKVLSKKEQKRYAKQILAPTKIYVKPVLDVIKNVNVKGISHITGGAFYGKLARILPRDKNAVVYKSSWNVPRIFGLIQKRGNISQREMYSTFNMGIGMVLAVSPKDVSRAQRILSKNKLKSWVIGEIKKGSRKIEIL